MKKHLFWMAIFIIGQSCRKEATPFYSGDQGLFFKTDSNSSDVPFGEKREFITDFIVSGKVYLFGPRLKQTASFRLQVDEISTAVAGRDYELPSSFTFKADSLQDTVFIRMLRSPAMHDDTLTLVLHLVPNTTFPATWQEGDGQQYSMTFTINISDHINKPENWDNIIHFYGPYSDKKLRLLISFADPDILRVKEDIINRLGSEAAAKSYKLKKYLKEQLAAGTPVYETDGSLMEAGPDAPDNY